jgi:hypothetical protein
MRSKETVVLFALAFGTWLGLGTMEKGRIGVDTAEAAGGCGIGFHRGPYGGCRPNVYGGYYGAPGYYRGGAVYGYRGGAVYGRRVYGGRVYGGRGVYARRAGGFAGGRGYHGGGFRGGRFHR